VKKKDDARPVRVVLRGYGQIRRFFKELGFNPPPGAGTLYKWARYKGCPISRALDGNRVVSDAKDLAVWIRKKYFGTRVGRPRDTGPSGDTPVSADPN